MRIPKKKIAGLCKKHQIILLILHGSHARGQSGRSSDLDIGILAKNKIHSEQYMIMLEDFGEVFGEKFDPVILNSTEPLISYQVAIHGKLLFEQKKGAFAAFRIQAISRFLDSKKFRDLEIIYIKRAIARI